MGLLPICKRRAMHRRVLLLLFQYQILTAFLCPPGVASSERGKRMCPNTGAAGFPVLRQWADRACALAAARRIGYNGGSQAAKACVPRGGERRS
jgi:hypothetical protein